MSKRPNIIFITADQHRGDCFGFEGRKVKTPHLDQLAREGTHFATCITSNPVCQPARASLVTGLLPRTHGVSDNGIDLDPELGEKGFGGALTASGYNTALIGKAHFATAHTFEPTGSAECRDSMANYSEDWFGPYMGFSHVELVVEGHNIHLPLQPPNGQHYERWYYADGHGAEKNEAYAANVGPDTKGAPQTWHSGLPPVWHNSTWVADRTIAQINEVQDADEPFFIWASFPDPHHPFDCPVPWSLLHRPEDVDLPEHRTLDLENRPWWHKQALEGKPDIREDLAEFRTKFSRTPVMDDDQLREVIANYYGMIALIDHNVGRIMAELGRLGLEDNTIIIYSADHGDWLGDHGLLLKGPMLYDGLLRVGCIVKGPGVPAGKRVTDPVSNLDFAATILDYADAPQLMDMHSRSLRDLIETDEASREFAYNEWDLRSSRSGVALDLRTVRTASQRLSKDMISGAGEMYDLEQDPDERINLYDDPDHADMRASLEAMIASRPDDALPNQLPQVGMA